MLPVENRLEDLEAYAAVWREAGFASPRIREITERSWIAYCSYLERKSIARGDGGAADHFQSMRRAVKHYVIASADR
jgi:hypothetical protein